VGVSIPPQAFLVERLGGQHVDVVTMLRAGESPATFQPSDIEVSKVLRTELFFRIGVPFESGAWFKAISGSGGKVRVVDVRKGIALREMAAHRHERPGSSGEHCDHGHHDHVDHGHAHHDHGDGGAHAGKDPHVWLAPQLLKVQARTMADALKDADPAHADAYEANLAGLNEELDRLHAEIADRLKDQKGRRLYLYHPAWGYFCAAYGLEQYPIEIEGKEPTDAELTEIQKRAKEDDVDVIFVQPQIAGRSAEKVAAAIGAEIRKLDPLAKDVIANLRSVAETIGKAPK
jgi:zinc transport system substrate-binding protein